METLSNLESFVRSAEAGSFSAAARLMGLTPAAVSRNVAMLERNIGVRLFQRSTRKLMLTEAGERFLQSIGPQLHEIGAAIASISADDGEPSGVLRVSMGPTFASNYMLPLLPDFLARYPAVQPDWHLENRQVDLIAEGFDAAIGAGFELTPGLVSRALAPAHIIAVASPAYMASKIPPTDPSGLAGLDGIVMRSQTSGRIRHWTMRNIEGAEYVARQRERIVFSDPAAMVQAAVLGQGVALVTVPDALAYLNSGELIRLLSHWYSDIGAISLYYSSRALLPAKTRVFVDFIVESFRQQKLAERFAGSLG